MNNLKKLRKDKGLTQQELAQEMETTKLTISNWENEKHTIKADKAQQLADYFGVSVGYLLGYSNDPKRYDDEVVIEPEKGTILTYSLERSNKKLQEKMFKFCLYILWCRLPISIMPPQEADSLSI